MEMLRPENVGENGIASGVEGGDNGRGWRRRGGDSGGGWWKRWLRR